MVACLIGLAAAPARAAKGVDGVVNINTADAGVLGLLPGIGPSKAAQIIAYRKRHPFRTVDELVRIRGIGRKMVRHLRVHLAVAGPTTATGVVVPATVAPPPPRHRRRVRRLRHPGWCARDPRQPSRSARHGRRTVSCLRSP